MSGSRRLKKYCKYQDFALEISRMGNTKTRVISIVIGALGAESLLTEYLALIGLMSRKLIACSKLLS